jgi:signal peptidase II
MNTKHKIKIYIMPILCIGLLVALDQITKFIVRTSFALYESHPLIKNVFHLTYIQNTGIAWGMFKNGRTIFLILTVLVLLVCACFYAKIPQNKRFTPIRVCLVFLVSGAIGNMIDRISLRYVVDFFDFRLINFPIFNVADIYVTVSMIVLILLCAFYYHEHEIDALLSKSERKTMSQKQETGNDTAIETDFDSEESKTNKE